jgi:DNA-directed RNA polymerase specialized sigma24 family protein
VALNHFTIITFPEGSAMSRTPLENEISLICAIASKLSKRYWIAGMSHEDIRQEAITVGLRCLPNHNPMCHRPLGHYLRRRMVKRLCRLLARREKENAILLPDEELLYFCDERQQKDEDRQEELERSHLKVRERAAEIVAIANRVLPPKQAAIIRMTLDDESTSAIASRIGHAPGVVRALRSRATKRIRKYFFPGVALGTQ